MRLAELQYELPKRLIAQRPCDPRDASRLLVLHRDGGRIEHTAFRSIAEYLQPGDCLVRNNTRVLPARFFCRRNTGGRVEALFLHAAESAWTVLLRPSSRLRAGQHLAVECSAHRLELLERGERGQWRVRAEPPVDPHTLLELVGQPPLPPYIRRQPHPNAEDVLRYQTVYASRPGAAAAPTAGLHFSPELLERLARCGVNSAELTLHVGLGTFAPILTDNLAEHRMHAEWFELPGATVAAAARARACGRRIVAVGTTSARVLESVPETIGGTRRGEPQGDQMHRDEPPGDESCRGEKHFGLSHSGWTDIFIYPPYAFRNVDALLTNFHLPGSTLLAMVMAFAGMENARRAYREAIEREYRFFSYGDAMLIV
ncbi:MAG: S-adenosylmethionine:tRNA ribosyltransferase-isomerase [Phycisphaerae bacterium]